MGLTMAKIENSTRTEMVTLPDNLHWPGEFSGWRPSNQQTKFSLNGTPITQVNPLIAGRPIVLVGFWLKRAAVEILFLWSSTGEQYYLTLPDGREFLVRFADTDALEAAPVFEDAAPTADTDYLVSTLKLFSQPI